MTAKIPATVEVTSYQPVIGVGDMQGVLGKHQGLLLLGTQHTQDTKYGRTRGRFAVCFIMRYCRRRGRFRG